MIGFPFDSMVEYDPETGDPQFDRAVSSQPMRKLIRDLFSTGVMPNPSNNLQVSSGVDGMTVQVSPGFAVVDGGLCQEAELRTLEVTAADNNYDRIDTVILRWNENVDVRTADLYIKAGTPAASPVRPELQRNNSIYEIGLADVFVTRRVATITNDKITDTRYESERCGIVSSVSEWDTTTIYQQVQADLAGFKSEEEAEFLVWFDYIKDILDESTAGHLQNEIEELQSGKADLVGGNTFIGGNQTVKGRNIGSQSDNITAGTTPQSNTWGNSRINFADASGNRVGFIQPMLMTDGTVDLNIKADNGKVKVNGVDIEQLTELPAWTQIGSTGVYYRKHNRIVEIDISKTVTVTNQGIKLADLPNDLVPSRNVVTLAANTLSPDAPNIQIFLDVNAKSLRAMSWSTVSNITLRGHLVYLV